MDTAGEVLVEFGRLARAAGYGWLPILAMLLLFAAIKVLGPKMHLKVTPSEPPLSPGKPIESGEGGPVVDSAGNPVTSDPENPGGGPTGGMG